MSSSVYRGDVFRDRAARRADSSKPDVVTLANELRGSLLIPCMLSISSRNLMWSIRNVEVGDLSTTI